MSTTHSAHWVRHQVSELANTIAGQAEAIRDGKASGSAYSLARLMRDNANTLVTWLTNLPNLPKTCVKCDRAIPVPELAPSEPERCEDCADLATGMLAEGYDDDDGDDNGAEVES